MKPKRKRHSKEAIYPLVEEWLSTGERKKDLCQRHGIKVHILDYWLGKYRGEKGKEDLASKSSFIPIKISAAAKSIDQGHSEKIEIHYADGTQVRLPKHLSLEQIRILVPTFSSAYV